MYLGKLTAVKKLCRNIKGIFYPIAFNSLEYNIG
jgi:hypothetical protein